ncbi:hypothetical protein B0O99DRAFT_593102 [Bisporella sp. PMI_857]|nr:hypothetical protein B0O99DRAFT_593102 [Bisporella sp. PMI_857]
MPVTRSRSLAASNNNGIQTRSSTAARNKAPSRSQATRRQASPHLAVRRSTRLARNLKLQAKRELSDSIDPGNGWKLKRILKGPEWRLFSDYNRAQKAYLVDWASMGRHKWVPSWSAQRDIHKDVIKRHLQKVKGMRKPREEDQVKRVLYHEEYFWDADGRRRRRCWRYLCEFYGEGVQRGWRSLGRVRRLWRRYERMVKRRKRWVSEH